MSLLRSSFNKTLLPLCDHDGRLCCLRGRLQGSLMPCGVLKFLLAKEHSKLHYSGCCRKWTVAGGLPPFWLCKSGIMQKSYLSLVLFLLNQLSTCLYSSVTVTCHCFALTPCLQRSLSQGRAGKEAAPLRSSRMRLAGIPQRHWVAPVLTRHRKPHGAEGITEIANWWISLLSPCQISPISCWLVLRGIPVLMKAVHI